MAVGRSVDREVMQNDRLAVRGQHDVDLDHRCAPGFRRLESRERVLWVVEAVAPVTADLDAPGLAGNKAEGHMRSGSCQMCPERATSAASSVLAIRPAPSGLDHCFEALHNPVAQLRNNKARRRGEGVAGGREGDDAPLEDRKTGA